DDILQDPLALGLLQVERYPELAGVDLHERAAAIEPLLGRRRDRTRGRLPFGAPTERTGGCTEAHAVGARFVFDLDHLGPHRREEASRAGAGEHPAEIDDAHTGEGEGLACGTPL